VSQEFVHLRVHSAFSLSEGALTTKDIVNLCTVNKMAAVAVTDTNNMFGALEHSTTFADAGIQPIIGCTLNIRTVDDKTLQGMSRTQQEAAEHAQMVFLVQNETGYANLIRLVSKAYMASDGVSDPHIELADLAADNDGLIALSGGPDGPIGQLLQQDHLKDAKVLTETLSGYFPGRFYIEIMRHGLPEEQHTEPDFLTLAYDLDLPLVATNDAYFSGQNMFEAHDALLCIAQGSYVGQTDRRHVTSEHYFKSGADMVALFEDLPEAIANTKVIAQRCGFKVPMLPPILPEYGTAGREGEAEAVKQQSYDGLRERLEAAVFTEEMDEAKREEVAKPYFDRLDYELGIIIDMEFPGYFLIVSDFIKWAKEHNVPVGPGRGSGAGSVVAWALKITDLDPLRFGLLFERFLNPERVSMPDFDIDFCQDKRDQVIRYVQDKYGSDQVAQIITFGKLQARAALRDVGRVLEMPYGQVDRLCKMVPNNPANPVSLKEAVEGEPRLQAERDQDEAVAHLLDTAMKLEGLYRHASTHAAGVVIGDRPLDQLVPLYRDPRSPMPVTQYNMKWVEPAGLVKFDFLGLKTLTVIHQAVALIAQRGIDIDIDHLPLDDRPTYDLLARGDSVGVFQLEGSGMRDVLRKLRPDQFEDIIALVALYRPGPMDNIPTYIKRKHGEETPDYMHERLTSVLEETFGVIIYQEQVMQIAQILAGYSLGEADLLRRAMGKKKIEEMAAQRARFVEGAVERDVDKNQASQIFDLVDKFAGYGFNKSHAAAYALVAYQTAWLKANYPVEFMAASMTLDMGNTDKLDIFRRELKRLDIELLSPDISKSAVDFSVETLPDGELAIRYALAAVKNVGAQAMQVLVDERSEKGAFASLEDFAKRVDPRQVNKRQLENLVRAGAFDGLNDNRRQSFEGIETILQHANAATRERESNQDSLFGDAMGGTGVDESIPLPQVRDWPKMEKLQQEQGAVGFFLTAHPLDASQKALAQQNVLNWAEAEKRIRQGATGFQIAGMISRVQERKSQRGRPYAFVDLSDSTGSFEVTMFTQALEASRELLVANTSVVLTVEARLEDDQPRMMVQSVRSLDSVVAKASAGLRLIIDNPTPLNEIQDVLTGSNRGNGMVHLVVDLEDQSRTVEVTLQQRYAITPQVRDLLDTVTGVRDIQEI
jgi:DNA polymerase-3 subunit alpha